MPPELEDPLMTTTFHINTHERTVEFTDRRGFVLGETYSPAIVSGIQGCELGSLAVFFYNPDTGGLLAGCFNVVGSTPITKVLDRYHMSFNFLSQSCIDLFAIPVGETVPPSAAEVMMIVRDANLVYCRQIVPLFYATVLNAGPEPELPALTAAIAAHNIDPDAHLNLISKADVAGVIKFNLLDDSASFTDLCTVVNNLIDALQAPRA
jgi:hypothetical protein